MLQEFKYLYISPKAFFFPFIKFICFMRCATLSGYRGDGSHMINHDNKSFQIAKTYGSAV